MPEAAFVAAHDEVPLHVLTEQRRSRADVDAERPRRVQVLRRGVEVEVLQDARCVEMMRRFIASSPELWNEDIGES